MTSCPIRSALPPVALVLVIPLLFVGSARNAATAGDPIATLQTAAIANGTAEFGHWGNNPKKYSSWTSHTNRLIPLFTFGGNLNELSGDRSVYRSKERLTKLYGDLPSNTLNPQAGYIDQTDVYRLQTLAVESGKKRIVLFVFDGMDWQTIRAAAIAKSGAVSYAEGRGSGLAFQDYRGVETDFGYFVTSPHNEGTSTNVNQQTITNPGGKIPGGYDPRRGGEAPWSVASDPLYPIAAGEGEKHAYTDSAASAASMTTGIKTYNDAINVDFVGREVRPIARRLQEQGFAVGVVTSVPISHATPACAYANNVNRSDYQDLTRDLLGIPSVFHPGGLEGVDVLLGAGWGEDSDKDGGQGDNFVPGNKYLTAEDQARISIEHGGKYVVAQRTAGKRGIDVLKAAGERSIAHGDRLFGYFGVKLGHLPFQTADGGYDPVVNIGNTEAAKAEVYSAADVQENVTLSDMTQVALDVLQARSDRWWLMIEAGDVDWANHSNNIDNSIGAVLSGELAFQTLTGWIENHGGWDETFVALTADHGHYLVLDKPELLAAPR